MRRPSDATKSAARRGARGPTREELLAARGRTVPDVIAPDLHVLFCGINPGLYTAWAGHHFARPGNRFWPALHMAGYTPRLFAPHEEQLLLPLGYGITNLARRATATAAELTPKELVAGGRRLRQVVARERPHSLAVLGLTAYRLAFQAPRARLGEQPAWGSTAVWVLPNPSGLNAHFQLPELAKLFREVRARSGAGDAIPRPQ